MKMSKLAYFSELFLFPPFIIFMTAIAFHSSVPPRPAPCWVALGFDLATAATGGMVAGYLGYVLIHYLIHHMQPRRGTYLYRVRQRHSLHHYISDKGNFGVTTDVWDRVFGTALMRKQRPN